MSQNSSKSEEWPEPGDFGPVRVQAPLTRRSVEELAPFLMLSVKHRYTIRPAADFVSRSDDLAGQIVELIDHLFVRYPVPRCLYRAMLSNEGLGVVFPGESHRLSIQSRLKQEVEYRRWFQMIACGEPFSLAARNSLTKRQAHWFALSPHRLRIAEAILWSQAAAAGVPLQGCDYLVERLGEYGFRNLGDQAPELFAFYARHWEELGPAERDEVLDYLRTMLDGSGFSLKGRTLASVRRLSHAWHHRFSHPFEVQNLSWKSKYEAWEIDHAQASVRALELTSTQALTEESAVMRHCVHSYARACRAGHSRIISFRWIARSGTAEIEVTRITVEVSPAHRAVVQIRGYANRRATDHERAIIAR